MTEKMTSFLSRTKYNAKYLAAAGATGTLMAGSALPVFALQTNKKNVTDATAEGIVSKIVDMVAMIARYIGIVLLAWGVVQLVLAFKNEDADSKSRAMMLIIVSVALIAVKTFINMVLGSIK